MSLINTTRYTGMINIFRSIGCIGDSLSSGEFEYDNGGEIEYRDYYEYSWGKQIEHLTGIAVTNFSRGGLTAYQLYKEATEQTSPIDDINRLFNADNAKQAYIIALGVNDITRKDVLRNIYSGNMGNAQTDIDVSDYNNNAPSFVGWYAKIIQRLKTISPDAKFFLVTMPSDRGSEEFNRAIEGIAGRLDNCYVIDFYTYAPEYDDQFREKYFSGGHMNAMGYLLTAHYIMTFVDLIIRNNPDEFKYISFAGVEYRLVK